jgi:hypothetical protein
MKVLAFDIGIKNLAFCILEKNVVHRLENCNILDAVEKTKCSNESCKHDASWSAGPNHYCKRHIPKSFTIVNTIPKIADLKKLAKSQDINTAKKTKADILLMLSSTHAFPYMQPKQPKASTTSLATLHDALRRFVNTYWEDFAGCNAVLLENQPAFKNPHMKSVQVLLFATLREKFIASGTIQPFHLVHAKKKVKDAEAGDAGYAERKSKSEQRVTELFESDKIGPKTIFEEWQKCKKRNDMADAVCMCFDFLSDEK